MRKYRLLLEGEVNKRKHRVILEKAARTKGTQRDQITERVKEARGAGLSVDECKDAETDWFQRSGKL